MAIIATYDVPREHGPLKKALFEMGYTDRILHNENGTPRYIYLPNTTVYHTGKTADQARKDIQNVCVALHISLERCVATQWGPDWAAIWGIAF